MPLPLAAIAAAMTTAALTHLQQQQRDANAAASGPQVGKLLIGGSAVRASTIAALSGGAAGFQLAPNGAIVPATPGPNVGAGGAMAPSAVNAAIQALLAPKPGAATGAGGAAGSAAAFLNLGTITGRRRRRMNVANVPALRRAGRRLSGFVKLAKKMVTLEQRARLKKKRRR